MKLHPTVVDKIVKLFESYGGHRGEKKLRSVVAELELSEYERQTGEKILVLSEQLMQETDQILGR
jgi:hypothetical protein